MDFRSSRGRHVRGLPVTVPPRMRTDPNPEVELVNNGARRASAARFFMANVSKIEMLRLLINQRLTAAAEEIFGVFGRTIAEYEEEISRSKVEIDRQRRLLDLTRQPQISVRADCSGGTRSGTLRGSASPTGGTTLPPGILMVFF